MQKFLKFLKSFIFFNAFFRYFIELSLESGFGLYLNMFNIEVATYGDFASLLFGYIYLAMNIVLMTVVPIWVLVQFRKRRRHLAEQRFEEIVSNINESTHAWLFYYPIFILRRYLFVITTFEMKNLLYPKILVFLVTNLLYLCYLIHYRPKLEAMSMEIFNELCTLVLTYLIFLYTDFVGSSEVKNESSYAFISVYLLNISVNLIVIVYSTIKEVKLKAKRVIMLRRAKMMKGIRDNIKNKVKLDGISIRPVSLDIINEDEAENLDA